MAETPGELVLRCADSLRDNHHFYASKARRKKIALIRVEAINQAAVSVQLNLGEATLVIGDRIRRLERPEVILRRLSEFTWDFLLYLIFSFHPVEALIDVAVLLSGPLLNRRLRSHLSALSDGDLVLGPGEQKSILLGFQDAAKGTAQVDLSYCFSGGEQRHLQCKVA